MSFEFENLPDPDDVSFSGGAGDTILAQFYRIAPVATNNINIPIPDAADRGFLPVNAFNNTQGTPMVEFPDNNSMKFLGSGRFLHTITIYMATDVNGIVALDLVKDDNTAYSDAVFVVKDSTPSSNSPLVLNAVIDHDTDDIIKLRFGGASPGNLGIVPTIWAIFWSVKS